jgi:hypothetical protein
MDVNHLDDLAPGATVDGFTLGECVHAGAMGRIFRVTGPDAGFPLLMKVPHFGPAHDEEGLISFETEAMIMPELTEAHVPRFVAAGDLALVPYLVMEWIDGASLESRLKDGKLPAPEVAHIGAAIADALHGIHQQEVIHLDLKPDNIIVTPSGEARLIDFGLAHHARLPDLLAEEKRFAAGSAPYISPEQVLGTRSDPRSDIFALGVVLYELATDEFPFGAPATIAGLRDRLWKDPLPPRAHAPDLPPWLQEVILRCIEPDVTARYQSAAHVAFDLRNPDQVVLTARAAKQERAGVLSQIHRWWNARGVGIEATRAPSRVILASAPVFMVAVDTMHPDDERQPYLQRTIRQMLALPLEFRLICVSVIRGVSAGNDENSGSAAHLEHLVRLRHWVEPLRLPPQRLSLHVIESLNPAATLLDFARRNHVDVIVLGAPDPSQHSLAWWRSVASGVTANAQCSVHVVRVPRLRRGALPESIADGAPNSAA